jgi:zinc protease
MSTTRLPSCRTLAAVFLVVLTAASRPVLAAQAAEAPPPRLTVPYSLFTLPNGLTVILHEDHTLPVVSVNVWYHVGSGREKPGRTGFAHLFEHLMFEGSKHVKEGEFDSLLEAAGGDNNGSTTSDRTNYWINVPSNALELALFLESDRMGYLLDVVTPELVDGQRDVVKNERRQGVENAPYGQAQVRLDELLYPKDHPYHWPTIGYMDDLTAASHDDVTDFFRTYYVPANASLVIAGDIDPVRTRALVEKWFSDVKAGPEPRPLAPVPATLTSVVRETIEDRVQLPRIYLAWLTPAHFAPADADLDLVARVLAGGKNSRLYKRLVYDMQVAQGVFAVQQSAALGSQFVIVVTAKPAPGAAAKSPQAMIDDVRTIVDEEIARLRAEPPTQRELQRAVNQIEAEYFDALERVGGFGGKADLLNAYFVETGNPDFFNEDVSRYRARSETDVQAAVLRWLPADRRVELTVLPKGQ